MVKKKIETQQFEIEKLSEIEHIRRKSGMYIGSGETPIQLFNEVIDNALDECISGFSNKIEIINDDKEYIVRDWGRGIPLTSSKMPGLDVPIEIVTKSFSGGKFSSGLYSFSCGMHGLGLTLTNALSTDLIITTIYSDTEYIRYHFINGEFNHKEVIKKNTDTYSTEIRFTPDSEYFDSMAIDLDIIKKRLEAARTCLSDDTIIIFNNVSIDTDIVKEFFNDDINTYPIVSASYKNKLNEETKLYLQLVDVDDGKQFKGVVNLIPTDDGTNYRATIGIIKDMMMDVANRQKMEIKKPDDLLVPLKIVTVLKLKLPSFDSQTKNKLTTKREIFEDGIIQCMSTIIKDNPDFIINWIKKSEEYRIQLESNRASKKRTVGKAVVVKGLYEAVNWKDGNAELICNEGLSAAGALIKCRDPKIHAILALRGKPINAMVKSKAMILQNDVISSIVAACGYKSFGVIDPEKCRYDKILVCADGDADGSHITCLVVLLFMKLMPELIKAGKLYIVKNPLFGYMDGKKFIPIYDEIEARKMIADGKKLNRYKGLGEMDDHELYTTALDPTTRRLYRVIYDENLVFKDEWPHMGQLSLEEIIGK